jgi:hypothetical protein
MQSLCAQHNLSTLSLPQNLKKTFHSIHNRFVLAAIPERVQAKLCESCGAFVYWSPLKESAQSESSSSTNTTTVLSTRTKVRLRRSQKRPKTLNRLLQSERKKLTVRVTTQKKPQRIYIRNFLVAAVNSGCFRQF